MRGKQSTFEFIPKLKQRTAAREARDTALQQVEENADAEWKEKALRAVHQTALQLREFISDDIWEVSQLDSPREARALGPVLLEAARQGWIVKTNYVRPSVRSHLSGKPVWLSSIYKGM